MLSPVRSTHSFFNPCVSPTPLFLPLARAHVQPKASYCAVLMGMSTASEKSNQLQIKPKRLGLFLGTSFPAMLLFVPVRNKCRSEGNKSFNQEKLWMWEYENAKKWLWTQI